MARWYACHNTTPADPASLQEVPDPGSYVDLADGDYCLAYLDTKLHLYQYDASSALTEELDRVVTPTGNAGNGRWILKQVFITDHNGFPVKVGPPTDSTISFTDGTRTFSIQPTVTDFDYYIGGVRYTTTGDTVVITDVEGLHWIYYDTDGVLKVQAPGSSTDELILEKCLVGNVYWSVLQAEGIIVGDERHGNDMSPASHYHFHESLGAMWESGLSLSNFDSDGSGNDATAAQFDVVDGEFHDEDIEIEITDGSPQQLVNATIPTYYRLGVGGLWRKLDATTNFPVADGTIGDRLDWNDYNGGTWQLQEVTNLQYTLTHYFATNDIANPIIGIMGQNEYANLNSARTGAETELASISLAGLPGAEYIPIATVIWQTADTYTNQVAARIRVTDTGDDYIDWRQQRISGAGGTTSDHESLANLLGGAAGDHYHLTGTQHDDLTDGGDTTLHDHDGISENNTHRTSTGADHTYIDQSVVSGASPVLKGTNFDEAEWTEQQGFNETAITSSSNSVAWDVSSNQCARHTLTENTTFAAPTNIKQGTTYYLRVIQAAGLYTVAWNSVFKWGYATTPAAPAASADEVLFAFYSDGTNMIGTEVNRQEA